MENIDSELYDKGMECFDKDEFEKALDYFEKYLKENPDNQDTWFMKALIFLNLEKDSAALSAINKAIELNPNDVEAWIKKAWILLISNEQKQGLNATEMALDLENDHSEALYLKGRFLLNLGNYSEALLYLDEYPEEEPLYLESLFYKGDALYNLGESEKAMNSFDESLKIDPEDPDVLNYKGFILRMLEDFDKARECFEMAIKINPDFILPYYNLGIIEKDTKNPKKALNFFEKVLNIDSEFTEAWLDKGIILQRLNKKKESLESYKKFVEIVEKNNIEDEKLRARRVKEFIYNQENTGRPIKVEPNEQPTYWQWITRAEYFLDPNGKERESLEPREDLEPGSWWTCHKDTKFGDLILLYRAGKKNGVTYQDLKYLIMATSDAYPISDDEYAFDHGWAYGCDYRPLYKFENSINLDEMKKDPYLDEWNALNANFNRSVYKTEERHWNYLIQLLKDRNPGFDIKDLKIKEIIDEYTTEFELEGALFENISALKKFGFDLDLVGRQVICKGPGGRIDILTKDKKTGEYLVIELKIVRASRDTFGQISEYVGWVIERLSNGKQVKGLVISKGYDNKFKSALNTNSNIQQIELSEVLRELGMKLK